MKKFERRKEERPQDILEAALDVFGDFGFKAARMDEIARRAGVVKGTLYLYYPTKEALLKELIIQRIQSVLKTIVQEEDDARTALTRLKSILKILRSSIVLTKNARIPRIILAEARLFPELASYYFETVIEPGHQKIMSLLQEGIKTGEFQPVPLRETARLILAPFLLAALWQQSLGPVIKEEFEWESYFHLSEHLLLNGLLSSAAS